MLPQSNPAAARAGVAGLFNSDLHCDVSRAMIQAGSPDAARLAPDAARREGPDRPPTGRPIGAERQCRLASTARAGRPRPHLRPLRSGQP